MRNCPGNYPTARKQLITFLQNRGFNPHPNEVFCPSTKHCWVDVAAQKDGDYWAFEYKSRNDSVRRGLEQCCSYAPAFNYVVLVADRHRASSSPYFGQFKRNGFGVWSHTVKGFYTILNPRRHTINKAGTVIEKQFKGIRARNVDANRRITEWL